MIMMITQARVKDQRVVRAKDTLTTTMMMTTPVLARDPRVARAERAKDTLTTTMMTILVPARDQKEARVEKVERATRVTQRVAKAEKVQKDM